MTTLAANPQGLDIIPARRVFKMGSVCLTDPDPERSPEDVLRLYAVNYPWLATATLSGPVYEDGQLVWQIEKPVVKTKG